MSAQDKLLETLSPLERAVIPYLKLTPEEIKNKAGIDQTSFLRALKFLENKGVLKIKIETQKIADLGTNGVYYKKNHLPERRLLLLLEKTSPLDLNEAKKQSKLSDNEFKVSLGVLKGKALADIKNGRLVMTASKSDLTKKFFEEKLLEKLPSSVEALEPEEKFALENLRKRKEIIELKDATQVGFELTEIGKKIAGKQISLDLIEEVTPEVIKNWSRGKKLRRYDIHSEVPKIYGGKRHFVNQSIDYGKRIWMDMGFKEMAGSKTVTSFWNFDALFTAQDHPVREMQDTFYLKDVEGKLPQDEKLIRAVEKSHETGTTGSKGWGYVWSEKDAKRVLLRTHTTCLSSKTLARLKKEDLPAKYFAIGKCFRNETVDWSHGFEFNQSEGIVIDPDANLRNLIGYLKEFAKKMGFTDIRIQPAYFPYTEPSVEGAVWHPEKKQWVEVLAAGIFRPEVTEPLLGAPIPVLAWGPGFDRLMMMAYSISDIRTLYENDLNDLRTKEMWKK